MNIQADNIVVGTWGLIMGKTRVETWGINTGRRHATDNTNLSSKGTRAKTVDIQSATFP
jgi:hypothetical protein